MGLHKRDLHIIDKAEEKLSEDHKKTINKVGKIRLMMAMRQVIKRMCNSCRQKAVLMFRSGAGVEGLGNTDIYCEECNEIFDRYLGGLI